MSALEQNGGSSASEDDQRYAGITDEKKRKRMIANRESARRSRMRKHRFMEDLLEEVGRAQIENNEISARVKELEEKCVALTNENDYLRAKTMELTKMVEALNGVINRMRMGVVVADPFARPWQIAFPMQPVSAPPVLFKN